MESEFAKFVLDQAATGSTLYGNGVSNRLYGPYAKNARQAIMSRIEGRPVPHSKCGASAVRKALCAYFAVAPNCIAIEDDDLQDRIERAASVVTA